MLNFKGMRFPIDVILVCIRWYVAGVVQKWPFWGNTGVAVPPSANREFKSAMSC